ncbi:MAG: phenylalanine--tRNA ligase subunit beta [Candidatus Mariimomonas ferrooxydans]
MKASIKWLKEFVDFSLTPAELANALTMAGLEVEDIVPNNEDEDDSILEISITPNRPDCLSITGIAREISAILRSPLKAEPVPVKEEDGAGPKIEIKDTNLCSRYSSRIILGVEVKPSPGWISKRLESHGIRPVNNIVDITNYVLWEMGHPLHAFDLDKLDGNSIIVKTAGSVKKFITLDGDEKTLGKDMLLIWDEKKPVAIAGVMGGLETEVTESTVNVLLESACFDQLSIRRTSKALNLSTESSYRFERGADINRSVSALDRAAQLFTEIAGGKSTKISDAYTKPFRSGDITITLGKINTILGTDITPYMAQEMLKGLEIETRIDGNSIIVTPPSFRLDIQMDMDVIEEIARLYGYDKIPSTLPAVRMQPVRKYTRWNIVKTVKDLMRKSGYSEAINYSFLNPSVLDKLRISQEDFRRNFIKIRNPLRIEEEALRTTLIPAILDNVSLNINRGEKSVKFFEISSVFLPSGQKLPHEVLKMAAVCLKDTGSSLWEGKHDGFYDLKGALENFFIELKIKNCSFIQEPSLSEPYLHPGKSCVIKLDSQIIGALGTLHPNVAQDFDINPNINLLELDIDLLLPYIPAKTTFSSLPKYPYIERDIAIVVSQDITAANAESVIRSINSDMIESVKLFDIYTGKPVPRDKKSLAFAIRYRAGDRTLTDTEVNQVHSKILNELENSLNAELRG